MSSESSNRKLRSHLRFQPFALLKFVAGPALIVGAAVFIHSVPEVAHAQINSRVVAPPALAASSHPARKEALPKAPVQVAMPAPPPVRYVPGMEEALVAAGEVTPEENADLDAALAAFHAAPLKAGEDGDFIDYAKPLIAFMEAHPKSGWNATLLANLGFGYYHAGYWSRAFTSFEKAWELGRDATSAQAKLVIDRTVGELAKMHARVGHDKELVAVINDIGKRPIGGPGAQLLQGAREGLWVFRNDPGMAYLCGPNALKNVLLTLKADKKQVKVAMDARSGRHGFSLTQLAALADKAKLKYTLVRREPGQPIPVPSIIHWKLNHYAAVVGRRGKLYEVADPTFGSASSELLTQRAIDEESSGYFLVPAKAMQKNTGWLTVSAKSPEAHAIYGMGTTTSAVSGATTPFDPCTGCTGAGGGQGVSSLPSDNRAPQMTIANANAMTVNLHLTDTPVGYKPQKGVPAMTKISYNSREDMEPATMSFSNMSPNWSFSWMSLIRDDPASGHEGLNVVRMGAGGGGYAYPSTGYNHTTGAMPNETMDFSVLSRAPVSGTATSYTHTLPDGSKEVFGLSNGAATYPRWMFLTSVVDPQGNTTTINYDGTFRITSIVDAMGRSTTFTYGLSGYPLLVTKVTDPFGRTSQLTYDTSQRLASITDPAGITSSFTYSGAEPTFVNTLATPYGTSNFSDTVNSHDTPETNTRSLTITDPLGYTDYLYFYQNPAVVPSTDPTCLVPTGLTGNDNGLLNLRNTFYWDKHAFAQGVTVSAGSIIAEDFTKAFTTHYYHDRLNVNNTSREIASVKPALEHRTWYNYVSQASSSVSGTFDVPYYTGRVLDDLSTQLTADTWNGYNLPLTHTDPLGRVTKYTYASNNIDVLTVQQLTTPPSTYTTIATYGSYNSQHEPQTYTGADGQVWHYTYNAAGQLSTVTDPNSGVTTRNYDASGRLSTVVNANSQTVLTLTYDSADRVLTRTDSQGYVLTYGYDALDRVTSITYPDSTTDLYDYNFQSGPYVGTASLELRKHTDRLGRVTTYGYDADRRLTSVTEPTSGSGTRTTTYAYWENGALKDLIDANGNDTHWEIDIEGRPTSKTYQYGTQNAQTEMYTYEASTSRLKAVTDVLGQVKTFAYANDDRLTGITYMGSPNTPNVTFAWDARYPRLTSMTDGLGTTSYAYTAVGTNGALKLSSIDGPFSNDTIGLTYDALGRLSGRNITGGNETFGYDAISRLTSHGTPLGTFTEGYLGQTGQITSQSVTNGGTTVSTAWGYDTNANDRRLISITNSGTTRSYALGYGSGPVNPYDIMSITDTAASGHPWATQSHTYSYDLIDRLLTANQTTPGNFTYGYDALDNATTVTTPSGTVTPAPAYNGLNQISTWGANSYVYDAKGNTLSGDGTRTYQWDAENRLTEIDYVGTSNKSVFSYDGLGRRTIQADTISGTTTTRRFLWCGNRICQTRDGSDNVSRRYLSEGEYNVSTGQKLVYMPDQLWSVRDVLDASSGNLVQSYDYTPYGSVARSNGTTPTDYEFSRLFNHPASGLNFAKYRAQDGNTGRWLSRDPLMESGGTNLYAYAPQNSINGIDPRGLYTIVVVNNNGPIGTHAGFFISTPGQPTFIYDPYGSFNPSATAPANVNSATRDQTYPPRGSDGTIEGSNFPDYWNFQHTDGPDIESYVFDTTPEEEDQLRQRARETGEQGTVLWDGTCAKNTSSVLSGVGPFKNLPYSNTPAGLGSSLPTVGGTPIYLPTTAR
jgi:RHS repeat-associated protein